MHYILVALCCVGTNILWAAENSVAAATPQTDVSIYYLAQIFGVMEGILHGTGSQILGNLSKAFNSILLIALGAVWAYTAFIGILNTASDGQFLGQRGASMWVPLRMVAGMCLLVPKSTTGYSIIQVLAMYCVIQGVNFSNFIWNTTLQYLERGGTIVEMAQPEMNRHFNPDQQEKLIRTIGKVLKTQVFTILLYNNLLEQKAQSDFKTIPNFAHTPPVFTSNLQKSYMHFPNIPAGNARQLKHLEGSCGTLQWDNSPLMNASVQLMVINLLPLADQIVKKITDQPAVIAPPVSLANQPHASAEPDISIRILPNLDTKEPFDVVRGQLLYTTYDFIALLKSELRYQAIIKTQNLKKTLDSLRNKMQQGGWITAGSHYYQLAQYNQNINTLNKDLQLPNLHMTGHSEKALNHLFQDKKFTHYLQVIDRYIEQEIEHALDLDRHYFSKSSINNLDHSSTDKADLYYQESLLKPLHKNIRLFQEQLEATLKTQLDPITSLSNMGHTIMGAVQSAWKDLEDKPNIFASILQDSGKSLTLVPLIFIWMTLNFTIGATLAYYIPLIPFLLFFFGSLTWLIQVMEAIFIGAPLACVGLSHPEGQSLYGKAGQAIMLMIHVMLRPVLMILGLIAGMVLSTVAFALFNHGYHIAIQMIDQLTGDLLSLFSHTSMMIIYTTSSYAIVSRTFAMIYDFPNKTLRWMEGLTEGQNESETAMQVKSGIDQYTNQSNSILRPPQ